MKRLNTLSHSGESGDNSTGIALLYLLFPLCFVSGDSSEAPGEARVWEGKQEGELT